MIICPNPECGAENEDGVLYCDQCGFDLSQVEPQAEETEIPVVQPEETEVQPAEEEVDIAAVPAVEQEEVAQPVVTPPPILETGVVEPQPVQEEPVQPAVEAGAAKLRVLRGEKPGEEFPIVFEGLHVIGRVDPEGKPVDIDLTDQEASLPSPSVSRQHAAIKFENRQYTIEDLGSTNGTYVNRGNRLQVGQPQELNDGDEVIVGRLYLKFTLA